MKFSRLARLLDMKIRIIQSIATLFRTLCFIGRFIRIEGFHIGESLATPL